MNSFVERHTDVIDGVISCFDRLIMTGTLPDICHPRAMTSFLFSQGIRIFDFKTWAMPLRDAIAGGAKELAASEGLEIIPYKKRLGRKDALVKEILEERGTHPGLVCIVSAMESCQTYKPWHNKQTHENYVVPDSSMCMHYYFYFIDKELGLCHLRVPTWAPYTLQFYCNGHNILAAKLDGLGVAYELCDNAFVSCEDWQMAQSVADSFDPSHIHRKLDHYAALYCPILGEFAKGYHWSISQAEYATDLIFNDQDVLSSLYDEITRTAIHAIRSDDIMTFLGRSPSANFTGDISSRYSVRKEGTCVKHKMDKCSIKIYDKHGVMLRIESTTNDISFFKHLRKVEHRDGTSSVKMAQMRKTIYSLGELRRLMGMANTRYLDFIAAVDDPSSAAKDLDRLSSRAHDGKRTYRGFNLFLDSDLDILRAIVSPGHNVGGFRNKNIREGTGLNGRQVSVVLRRLRMHGVVKKIGGTFKYYLTKYGKRVIAAGLKTREMAIIPILRGELLAA